MYLMINYEYYETNLYNYYKLFNAIFCKSRSAFDSCLNDNLDNAIYMPWILWEFPIAKPILKFDDKTLMGL